VDDAADLTQAQALAPEVITGLFWRICPPPSSNADHATLLRLIGLLNADADNKQIEHTLSGSPHLLFGLLRLVNSVALSSGRQRIGSIGHAITMLGRRQLQRWVMLLLYAERYDGSDMFSPLLLMTCVRARLMENLCRLSPGPLRAHADTAFMVGMLSSLDKVLGEPMARLLEKVSLPTEGEAALLHGEGPLAPLLALVESGEAVDRQAVTAGLERMRLNDEDWSRQSLAAWGWLERLREGG
jgi:c-di-GMP phosphodiesterase